MAADNLAKANFVLMLAIFALLLLGAYLAYDFVQNSPLGKLLMSSSSSSTPATS